jgi:hypothetical protein
MNIKDEDEQSFYIEAAMNNGTVTFNIPKNFLQKKKSGGYATKHVKAADIMK